MSQTDYYALRAVFEPALDAAAWKPPEARLVSLFTDADRARSAEIEAEARSRWPIVECVIVHRLGHMEPAEASVAVVEIS